MFLNLEDKAVEYLCFGVELCTKYFLVKIFWMGLEERKKKKRKQLLKSKKASLREEAVNDLDIKF